jgi:hypothetical protein
MTISGWNKDLQEEEGRKMWAILEGNPFSAKIGVFKNLQVG